MLLCKPYLLPDSCTYEIIPWDHLGDQTVQSNQLQEYQDLELLRQYKARYQISLDRIERKSLYAFVVFASPKTTQEVDSLEHAYILATTLAKLLVGASSVEN